MEQQLRYVKVTNRFESDYVDMFDGVPVTIAPGTSQNIRPEQAWHFFGYVEGVTKQQMLLHTAKRQGWNTSAHMTKGEDGKTLAERMFENLVIEPVIFRLVEQPAVDSDQPIPADPGEDDDKVEHAAPPPKFRPVPSKGRAPTRPPPDDDE